jgi:hypothetical protein
MLWGPVLVDLPTSLYYTDVTISLSFLHCQVIIRIIWFGSHPFVLKAEVVRGENDNNDNTDNNIEQPRVTSQ